MKSSNFVHCDNRCKSSGMLDHEPVYLPSPVKKIWEMNMKDSTKILPGHKHNYLTESSFDIHTYIKSHLLDTKEISKRGWFYNVYIFYDGTIVPRLPW